MFFVLLLKLLITFSVFFVPQICQLETHVVLNEGEAAAYVNAATVYSGLDYNDFSVEAYVNPAANPGPKPGGRKAEKGKRKSKAGMGKRKSRRPADTDDDSSPSSEEESEAHAGTPTPTALMISSVASDSIAPRPSPRVLD